MIQKALRYLVYSLVAVLPWQTVYLVREIFAEGEKWQYGTIGIYLSDVMIVGIIGLSGWAYRERIGVWMAKELRAPSLMTVLTCMLGLYLCAGVLWSLDPVLTMVYALRVICGILLALCVRTIPLNMRVLGIMCAGSILLSAVLAMGQFVLQKDFASTALGLSMHDPSVGGVSVVEIEGQRWLRAYGSFPHPNTLGAIMAMMIVLACCTALARRQSVLWKSLIIILIVACTAALLASFSRSGLIGCTVGMIFLLVTHIRYKLHVDVMKKLGTVMLAMFLTSVVFFTSYGNLWQTRVQGEARLEKLSLYERTSQVRQVRDVIQKNLLTGVGAGTYTKFIAEADKHSQPIWKYQPVHNTPLLIIAEIGVVGMLILVMLISIALVRIYRYCKLLPGNEVSMHIALVAILVVYSTTALFDHWQWSSHTGITTVALCVSLLCKKRVCV